MAAPVPKPTKLKALHGNPGKRRLPVNEPIPPSAPFLRVPPALSAEAKREWRYLIGQFSALGLITTVDRGTLAAYCAAYGRFIEAQRQIRKTGGAVVLDRDGALRRNPWTIVEKQAVETMIQLGSRFGMTPADRPKLGRPAAPSRGAEAGAPEQPHGDALSRFLQSDPDSSRH